MFDAARLNVQTVQILFQLLTQTFCHLYLADQSLQPAIDASNPSKDKHREDESSFSSSVEVFRSVLLRCCHLLDTLGGVPGI